MADETPRDEDTPQVPEETAAQNAPDAEGEPTPAQDATPSEAPAEQPATPEPAPAPESPSAQAPAEDEEDYEEEAPAPREKPAIPGMDLEVDIVMEGDDPLSRGEDDEDAPLTQEEQDAIDERPIAATIELAADARYRATGKRKRAVARVILKPGTGVYTINGRSLETFFPRDTLQRNIRQPLEAVAFNDRMDVDARMHGGGVSAQAGALRHGISRALLEADPNLRGELKRRGFLTRDARVKERKKAGLKKARKRPQFSKR
jgi:small subunit ribosomal protein S9